MNKKKVNTGKLFLLIFFNLILIISCGKKTKVNSNIDKFNKNYQLNFDDEIYQLGKEFKYSFEFKHSKKSKISEEVLKKIDFLKVNVVKWDFKNKKDTTLALKYVYEPDGQTASSILIENDSIVWIHPPRQYFFKILELNPFPYFKKLKIGSKWKDSLTIGSQYSDKRWALWKKNLINVVNYEIEKDTLIQTKFGELKCRKTTSYAFNKLGKTYLNSYFNEDYGFILLNYTNIDNSRLILKLEESSVKIDVDRIFNY